MDAQDDYLKHVDSSALLSAMERVEGWCNDAKADVEKYKQELTASKREGQEVSGQETRN